MSNDAWLLPEVETKPANPRDYIMPFGRYRGRTLAWIARSHRDYLLWCVDRLDGVPKVLETIKEFLTANPA